MREAECGMQEAGGRMREAECGMQNAGCRQSGSREVVAAGVRGCDGPAWDRCLGWVQSISPAPNSRLLELGHPPGAMSRRYSTVMSTGPTRPPTRTPGAQCRPSG
jgi:Tfp pilus assembly protein PilX